MLFFFFADMHFSSGTCIPSLLSRWNIDSVDMIRMKTSSFTVGSLLSKPAVTLTHEDFPHSGGRDKLLHQLGTDIIRLIIFTMRAVSKKVQASSFRSSCLCFWGMPLYCWHRLLIFAFYLLISVRTKDFSDLSAVLRDVLMPRVSYVIGDCWFYLFILWGHSCKSFTKLDDIKPESKIIMSWPK